MPNSGKPTPPNSSSGMKNSFPRPDSFLLPSSNSVSASETSQRSLINSLMPSAANSGSDLSKDRLLQLLNAVYSVYSSIEDEYEKVLKENAQLKLQIETLTKSNVNGEEPAAPNPSHASTSSSSTRPLANGTKPTGDETHSPPLQSAMDASLQKLRLLKGGEQLHKFTTNSRRKLVSATSRLRNIPAADAQIVRSYIKHTDGIWDVATPRTSICPYSIIGTASADRTAMIWNARSGQTITQYQGHDGSVNSIRFQPTRIISGDSVLILTASGDHTAHVWKVNPSQFPEKDAEDQLTGVEKDGDHSSSFAKSTKMLANYPLMVLRSHSSSVSCAEWLNGADQVITASWDRTAIVFDVETGDNLNSYAGHDDELTFVAVSRTQKLFVTSSKDTTFRLWDLREPNLHSVSVFQGHTDAVNCAVFTGGSQESIVSGGDDKWLRVWDLRNMRSPKASVRLDDGVNRISVSDALVVAAPMDKRSVGLYSINTGKLLRLPRPKRQGHQRAVTSCSWWDDSSASATYSPNTSMDCNLFTGGFDRQAVGWKVAPV